MHTTRRVFFTALFIAAAAVPALAQGAAPPGNTWSRGTTIDLIGGVARAASSSRPLIGGAAGWEITPRFGVDGSVAWLDRPGDAEAFAAAFTAHANLMGGRTAVPFVKGGVGLYRASFKSLADVEPDFYRRRLASGGSALASTATFTDPSFVVGGGATFFTTRHLAVSPEVEAIIVQRDSRHHVVTAVSLHVAYHFEIHPVTPSRE